MTITTFPKIKRGTKRAERSIADLLAVPGTERVRFRPPRLRKLACPFTP